MARKTGKTGKQKIPVKTLELLEQAVHQSESMMMIHSDNGLIYANPAVREFWPEITRGLENGLSLFEATKNQVRSIAPELDENGLNMATQFTMDNSFSGKASEAPGPDGRWVRATHYNLDDKVKAGIAVEITEMKEKHREVKKGRKVIREALNAMAGGFVLFDDQNIVRHLNDSFKKYIADSGGHIDIGMTREEFYEGFRESMGENMPVIDMDAVKRGRPDHEEQMPDGSYILRKHRYVEGLGEIITVSDISDIKNALLKAETAERAKSEFLANMSHEIRTPMNGIMGMAELLGNCELGYRERDFVNVIERSGNSLLTIINDILDFSKIEVGQLELDPQPFLLRDSIEDVTALLSTQVAVTGIDLLLRVQPGLPTTFVGDVGRIRQILTNIVGNAVKFTSEGHILIDVSGVQNIKTTDLSIRIEDTGIGIEGDKLEHIFDKFSQVDASTTRKFGGTGLGLSIARDLVKLMGGDIAVESIVGKGSTFMINLSLPNHENISDARPKGADIAGSTIVVIDDNAVNREILTEQLKYWKCKCVAVKSADIGLNILKAAAAKGVDIDLVIVDYQMPGKDGEDFIRAQKADPAIAAIPAIMLSSVDRSDLQSRMSDLGLSEFMTKPARASRLFDSIGNAISASGKRRLSRSQSPEPQVDNSPSETRNVSPVQSNHVDVLIAEDNDVNQMYAKYVMEELGLSYKIAANGRIAVEKWKLLSPKAVLMDISMPEMNGYEATGKIREIEKASGLPRTPIIAVTAHSLKGDREKCLQHDMDDYISKPMAIAHLRECLEKWKVLSQAEGQEAKNS